MKISAGIAKGRRTSTKRILLHARNQTRLRPTSSKVREALFDIIKNKISGATFVDLYAGTGTVGFEALSRGGKRTVFVEKNEFLVNTIKKTAHELGFICKTQIIKCSAEEFLKKASSNQEMFDIFFVDPPYQSDEIDKILPLISSKDLVNTEGFVIVEHFHKKRIPETIGNLEKHRSYRYGDTILSFYRKVNL
ncbi:MAG: 16S rRNA (guanine(966)-N(2))-methyltransferase RsmD [Nitrospirae bacterium]|nr:16S rRNA (guanine(966)-N(2))-methyltransferase RsmD [Nitrospirota bacterium]